MNDHADFSLSLSLSLCVRARQLLQTGVLKERPLWLDVVEAWPPLPTAQPTSGRPPELNYPEDLLRR